MNMNEKSEKDGKKNEKYEKNLQNQFGSHLDDKKMMPQEPDSSPLPEKASFVPDQENSSDEVAKDPSPPLKPEENKEPWQRNEDIQEKLSMVSSEFSPQPLKEEPEEKPANSSIVSHSKLQKETKVLPSGSHISLFDVKRIGHHPASLFILLGVVGFGLAALLFSVLSKHPSKKPVPKQVEDLTAIEMISPEDVVAQSQVSSVTDMDSQDEDVVVNRPMPSIVISGIIFDKNKGGLALINGKIVREGYFVDGVKLERVFPDKVELSFEGKKFILRSR